MAKWSFKDHLFGVPSSILGGVIPLQPGYIITYIYNYILLIRIPTSWTMIIYDSNPRYVRWYNPRKSSTNRGVERSHYHQRPRLIDQAVKVLQGNGWHLAWMQRGGLQTFDTWISRKESIFGTTVQVPTHTHGRTELYIYIYTYIIYVYIYIYVCVCMWGHGWHGMGINTMVWGEVFDFILRWPMGLPYDVSAIAK